MHGVQHSPTSESYVYAAAGSQSIATSTERNTFGAGVDVASASSVSPGPVRGPHTADGAAEQSVIVANPEQSVIVSQSGELVQGAGHDEVPVEEQIFDGVPTDLPKNLTLS